MSRIRVPTRLVQPYIQRLMDTLDPSCPLEIAASMLGYEKDSILNLMEGRTKTLEFNFVDLLFCKLGNPLELWREPQFAPYYDKLIPRCPNCGAELEFKQYETDIPDGGTGRGVRRVEMEDKGRKFCSHHCRATAQRKAKPKSHSRAVKRHRHKNREAYNAYMREYRARRTREGRPCGSR